LDKTIAVAPFYHQVILPFAETCEAQPLSEL